MKTTQNFLVAAMFATLLTIAPSISHAKVVIFDGFGDGDLNNNGIAFEADEVVGTYEPFYDPMTMTRDGSPLVFPAGTMVVGPTVADNVNDRGIRWFSTGGFGTSGSGDAASSPRIINDAAGVLPETVGNVGFVNVIPNPAQTQFIPALNKGLALSVESKGRGRTMSGFFETDNDYSNGKQGTIALGPKVGDEVKVSFDFRVWMSAPNFNSNATNHVPDYGHFRFGIFQDTDNQLGMTNNFAGSGFTPAVWGAENGLFRGDIAGPDGTGDHGWYVRIPLQDPASTAPGFAIGPNGRDARINEEINEASTSERLLEGGDNQTVAIPDQVNPNFVNLQITKRYNISLSLKRFDETGGSTDPNVDGDNIMATLTIKDLDNPSGIWTLSGFDSLNDLVGPGFDSDSWDYFHAGVYTAGVDAQEFDWIMDDFMVEQFGSNAPDDNADFDGDGDVDGRDFLIWQRGNSTNNGSPADLALWQAQYGTNPLVAAVAAVPEPASILLLGLSGMISLTLRRRNRG